jgi:hypothetical protein
MVKITMRMDICYSEIVLTGKKTDDKNQSKNETKYYQ